MISIGCSALWQTGTTGITNCFNRYNRQIRVFFTYSTEPVPVKGRQEKSFAAFGKKGDHLFSPEGMSGVVQSTLALWNVYLVKCLPS
ncbi:MAG: hypothetical protein BA873_13895 [Desulfobulbaceae bacterium C00003063]|nr:MAG: hypothetical protein BA873_13895 [Desulfobulbaceae bacterium C00003063]